MPLLAESDSAKIDQTDAIPFNQTFTWQGGQANGSHQRVGASDVDFKIGPTADSVACDCSSKPLRGGVYCSGKNVLMTMCVG